MIQPEDNFSDHSPDAGAPDEAHADWLARKVQDARAGLQKGTNQRIDEKQWAAIRAAKRSATQS